MTKFYDEFKNEVEIESVHRDLIGCAELIKVFTLVVLEKTPIKKASKELNVTTGLISTCIHNAFLWYKNYEWQNIANSYNELLDERERNRLASEAIRGKYPHITVAGMNKAIKSLSEERINYLKMNFHTFVKFELERAFHSFGG